MSQPGEPASEQGAAARVLLDCLAGNWTTQAIYVTAELGLADLIAAQPRTSTELAALTATHEPSLRQLLRALLALGVLTEGPHDTVLLTEVGNLLRSDTPGSLRSWARWWGLSLAPAWGELLYSVKTGDSARLRLAGTEGFDHLTRDPAAATIFYEATVELARLTSHLVVERYDFSPIESIVDVGGGYGELLACILRANAEMRGVLFELPQAIDGARTHLERAGVSARCTCVAGDFFESIPGGADAYLLANVLHNWTDERAGTILASCRRAMHERSRLLVIEQLFPEAGDAPPPRALAASDLTMLVAHGTGERTHSELERLLTDAGLTIAKKIGVGATSYLVEALPIR